MPASYVHQCVAKDACASLSLFDDTQLHAALLAGAEGPDPFFFSFLALPGAPLLPKLGALLHTRRTDEFLLALADCCKGSAVTRAYCCGFFTHYAADTTFHPFIYAHALTAEGVYSSTAHCTLEHTFETLHYRRQGHSTGLPVQMAGYIALSAQNKNRIAAALSEAIGRVFPGERVGVRRIRKSFEDSIVLCRLLRSQSGTKYRVLGAALRPLHLDDQLHAHMMPVTATEDDVMNDTHAPWASLWAPDAVRSESFSDLYIAAVDRAKALVSAANDYMLGCGSYASLRALHGGLSYDSGLPWQTTCAAKDAPGCRRRDIIAPVRRA